MSSAKQCERRMGTPWGLGWCRFDTGARGEREGNLAGDVSILQRAPAKCKNWEQKRRHAGAPLGDGRGELLLRGTPLSARHLDTHALTPPGQAVSIASASEP